MASPAPAFDQEAFQRGAAIQHDEADAKSARLKAEYRGEQNVKYGPHEKQFLDIWYPKQPVHNAPVLLFVHGAGGYVNFPERFAFVGRALLDHGCIFVVPSGRRQPDLVPPDAAEDIEEALGWVADNIRSRGGNPDRLYLAGESFGAMTAAEVAFKQEIIRHGLPPFAIKGLILFSGRYALEGAEGVNKQSARYTPNLRETLPHLPPHVIVVAGTNEQLPTSLPEARALYKSIQDNGGSAELFELEGIDHFHTIDSLAGEKGVVFQAAKRMIGL